MPRSYAELKGRLATTTRAMRSKAGTNVFEKEEVIRIYGFDKWVKFQVESLDGKKHLWRVERRDFVLVDPIKTLDSQVIVYVDAHPGSGPTEIAKALEAKVPAVSAALKRLWVKTLLDRKNGGYVVPLPKTKGRTWHDRLLASADLADQLTIR